MTPDPVPDGFAAAVRAFESGDVAGATELLQECVIAAPEHAGSRFGLAMCRLRQGNSVAAQRLLRETLQIDPHHGHAREQLSLLLTEAEAALTPKAAAPKPEDAAGVPLAATAEAAAAYAPSTVQDQGTLAGALDSPDDDPSSYSGELLQQGRRRLASHRSAMVSVLLLAAIPGLAYLHTSTPDRSMGSVGGVSITEAVSAAQVGCAVGAFLAMVLAALSSHLTTYRVFERRIDLRSGVLLRTYRQVWLYDVNDLQLSQTPLLTLAGTGRLRVLVDEASAPSGPPTMVGFGSYRHMQTLLADVQRRVLRERRAMKKQFL